MLFTQKCYPAMSAELNLRNSLSFAKEKTAQRQGFATI